MTDLGVVGRDDANGIGSERLSELREEKLNDRQSELGLEVVEPKKEKEKKDHLFIGTTQFIHRANYV